MRVIHLADVHLGYRAYNRVTSQGINRREADVFQAFRSALNEIVALDPDLIIIAGDLFHIVRPSNLTIQHTFREFASLRNKTKAPVVIIGGNHDSPRSADTGCILDILSNLPGVYVAHSDYVQIPITEIDTSVFCLCHRAIAGVSSLKMEPDPSSKYNILTVHGTVEGVIKQAYDITELSRSQIISDNWDYIAFGHYHSYEKLAQNAYYSGSLEYSSTNIWSETGTPKGFIEYNLDDRELVKFHEISARDVIDLRAIDAKEFTANELNIMIQNRLESVPGGHLDKIIRLVIENLPRSVQTDLDYSYVRKVRTEALHFELSMRPSSKTNKTHSDDENKTAVTIEEEWEYFASDYEIPAGVDRPELIETGKRYLRLNSAEVPDATGNL